MVNEDAATLISFGTWNIEAQVPDWSRLKHAFVWGALAATPSRLRPPLVAIGAQELRRSQGASLARRAFEAGAFGEGPAGRPYSWLGEVALPGRGAEGPCEQALSLLACPAALEAGVVAPPTLQPLDVGHPDGRGGVAARLALYGRPVWIVSAHLDSEDPDRRERDIDAMMDMLDHSDGGAPRTLLGGDLNYRCAPDRPRRVDELCAWILHDRARLYALDTLTTRPSRLVSKHGLHFPAPQARERASGGEPALSLPTYKIAWRGSATSGACRREVSTIEAVRARYFPALSWGDEVVVKPHRGTWSVGWLDRIGWRWADGAPSPTGRVTVDESTACSDHLPVLFDLTW